MRGDVNSFTYRLVVVSVLLIVPLLRMLLREDYGFLYPEVIVAVLILLTAASLIAAVSANRWMFAAAVAVLIATHSVNAVRLDFFPSVQLRWLLLGIVASYFLGLYLLKNNVYRILLVFVLGGYVVDIGQAMFDKSTRGDSAQVAGTRDVGHVVHIILDEMIGLAGMPRQYDECITAEDRVQKVLEGHAFQIYPYAFSNYRSTRDSIPSILNGRLLKRTGEFLSDDNPRPVLSENRYFDEYRKKDYGIRVYQSDYLTFATGNSGDVRTREYRANSLRALHAAKLPWPARLRQIAVIYVQSDQFWWGTWTRVLPPELQPDRLRVGPLALLNLWPEQVIYDLRAATKKSLFFVHALTPHYPYVHAGNGSLTDSQEWNSHSTLEFLENEPAGYVTRYRHYCEQVQFVASQLQTFLNRLKDSGLYDSTTIIVHGDHGSRLRLLRLDEQDLRRRVQQTPGPCPGVSRYDYGRDPDPRDLLNRFATLLAIKWPGATAPVIVNERGSVLFFLRRAFHYGSPSDGVEEMNWAYLFNADGSPRAIKTIVPAFHTVSSVSSKEGFAVSESR